MKPLPPWEDVLSSAARLQTVLPEAVLVGGTASSVYAGHRVSMDADPVLTDLRPRFDDVLAQLESVAGWKTARINRPVQILGSLDGIETGIRQLIRAEPLETRDVEVGGQRLRVPTHEEMTRIKAVLILKRNATRDYLDFAALADGLGDERTVAAMARFDALYPQPNGTSPTMQLELQLASPAPFDLDDIELAEYKHLAPRWHEWRAVIEVCARVARLLFTAVTVPAQTKSGATP